MTVMEVPVCAYRCSALPIPAIWSPCAPSVKNVTPWELAVETSDLNSLVRS